MHVLCCYMYVFCCSMYVLCCYIYCLFCVILCIVYVYMCTELLPPGGYSFAVIYIISYLITYHINNYNLLTLLLQKGYLKVQSKIRCGSFQNFIQFFHFMSHCLSQPTIWLVQFTVLVQCYPCTGATASIVTVGSTMLQTDCRPAGRSANYSLPAVTRTLHKLVLTIIYYPIFVPSITTSPAH
jgi:hypothetical protein